MNEEELEEKIKWLHSKEGGNIKQVVLQDENFIKQPEYKDIKNSFYDSKYHENQWKWHQLVRVVLEPVENRQYMYDRLLNLLLKHRTFYDDYFVLKTDLAKYHVPNPIADLNRLESLFQEYFQIYYNIKNQIHFDFPKTDYFGPSIRGKINWDRTLRNSTTSFPMNFASTIQHKEFETPGNILLVLCAEWIHRESNRLLQMRFVEPLDDYQRNLLEELVEKTKSILINFPFPLILNSSRKYWKLSYNDPRILQLEKASRKRIREGIVRNQNYSKLLDWIEKFREQNIKAVSENTPTRHPLESIQNVDTIYEAWIFLEFVNFLFEKGILIDLQLGEKPHCRFQYNNIVVTFWYEKYFQVGGLHAWAVTAKPDFTAMVDDQIIAVFDAKNYGKSDSITQTQNKMLAYMTNLDTNFGALIYPNHPKFWDDFNRSEKIEKMKLELIKKHPEKSENEILSLAKKNANLSWEQLQEDEKDIWPPKAVQTFSYPRPKDLARFHFNLTLCLMRMSPTKDDRLIQMKNQTLTSIFNAIISRIPITVKN